MMELQGATFSGREFFVQRSSDRDSLAGGQRPPCVRQGPGRSMPVIERRCDREVSFRDSRVWLDGFPGAWDACRAVPIGVRRLTDSSIPSILLFGRRGSSVVDRRGSGVVRETSCPRKVQRSPGRSAHRRHVRSCWGRRGDVTVSSVCPRSRATWESFETWSEKSVSPDCSRARRRDLRPRQRDRRSRRESHRSIDATRPGYSALRSIRGREPLESGVRAETAMVVAFVRRMGGGTARLAIAPR